MSDLKREFNSVERQDMEQLVEQARRHADEMASLYEVASALAAAVSLDEILETVLKKVHQVLACDVAFVSLVTADGRTLRIEAVEGEGAEELMGIELPIDQGINAWILREGTPTLVEDAVTDPRRFHTSGRTDAVRGAVGAPLMADGKTIGTIYGACHRPQAYTQEHLNYLAITAHQVAAAVQRARLYETMQRVHRDVAEERDRLVHLHRVIADVQRVDTLLAKLQLIADGICRLGWGRVSVSLRDSDLNVTDLVCAGFTVEDEAALRASLLPGSEWRRRFAGELERFRLGQCYYLPWSDRWVREHVQGVKSHAPEPSGMSTDGADVRQGEAWHPQDLLYVPLYGRRGEIRGIIGLDDPLDGRRPTNQSLYIIELFAQETALIMENAQLLEDLKLVNTDLQEMVEAQAHLLQTIEEMIVAVKPREGQEILDRLKGQEPDHA